ncbi:MAG: SPFH domain-containing protein [Myxococcota bacterium]
MTELKDEKLRGRLSGWITLPLSVLVLGASGLLFAYKLPVPASVAALAALILFAGHFTLQPNQAIVLTLFGSYVGTIRATGFGFVNPFFSKHRISLRARNLEGNMLKVNDKSGNPVEIGAVVVWRVRDTYHATFDVEDFEQYVRVQSESAVRELANHYAYDHGEEEEITLRNDLEAVAEELKNQLQTRVQSAGVEVIEARIAHLAYAPEIASAMLRRQQADAVIAARRKIVDGAVSMVEMALEALDEKGLVRMDPAQRASMVSSLLVVLCSESDTQPVLQTGNTHPAQRSAEPPPPAPEPTTSAYG